MTIHSLHISNPEGYLIFSKYYDISCRKNKNIAIQFEKLLYEHTHMYWDLAIDSIQAVTIS